MDRLTAAMTSRATNADAVTVSVVIPTYARPAELERCLAALDRQTRPPVDVIVVDDGSPVPYAEGLAARFERVRVVSQDQEGPARARYRGAQEAQGNVVALCDDDVVPPDDWLERAAACLQATGAVGVEGSTVPPPDVGPDHARIQENRSGGAFLTCNLLLRRDAMLACPPDPRFRRPFREDTDLALLVQERFGPIAFCPEAAMVHPTSGLTLSALLRTASWHYYDGLVIRRHGAATRGIGALELSVAGRQVTVLRPKQRLAVLQLASAVAIPLASGPVRRAALAVAVSSTVAAGLYEQRYWVRAARAHDPSRLRSPDVLRRAVAQAGRQSLANLVRGAAYAVGRARWALAPADAPS